jgi:hypothetical protein
MILIPYSSSFETKKNKVPVAGRNGETSKCGGEKHTQSVSPTAIFRSPPPSGGVHLPYCYVPFCFIILTPPLKIYHNKVPV